MLAPQGVGFPCLYGYRCLAIPSDTHPRISPHLLFVVWLQKGSMDKEYIIFQEDGLFGAKDQKGKVIIPPQYMEMQPLVVDCHWLEIINISMLTLILTTSK